MKVIYSLKEFAASVKALASGRYYSVKVEFTEYSDGTPRYEFGCYVDGYSWCSATTVESAISKLNDAINPSKAADIDVTIDAEETELMGTPGRD